MATRILQLPRFGQVITAAALASAETCVANFSTKRSMPPKKNVPEPTKPLLGRPSNNLKMGVVGLPNVGKSTFFNCVTNSAARAENFPFCTIDPEESRVAVPDDRFDWLCDLYKTVRIPAYLTVIDIAGLVKGAADGEGLGNAFLSHVNVSSNIILFEHSLSLDSSCRWYFPCHKGLFRRRSDSCGR